MLNLLQYFHSTIISSPPLPPQLVGRPQRQWSVQGGFTQGANLTVTVAVTIFKDRKQSLFNKNAFSSDQDITNHINLIPLLDIPGSEAVLESGDLERAESGAVFRLISQSRTFLIRPIIRPSRPQARPAQCCSPRT